MTAQEISDLLDAKLSPIINRLESIETKVDSIQEDIRKILKFVPVDNADFPKVNGKKQTATH